MSAPLYRGSLLWNVFRSIEQDDSCTTTVENERQHGRMRSVSRRHGSRKAVQRVAVEAVLTEWSMEHRSRGLSSLTQNDCKERFRTALLAVAARRSKRNKRGQGGRLVPAKLRFVNEQDSLDRRVAGRKRTRNEMLTNRKR